MSNYLKDLREAIIRWNNNYPLDKWWRDKHKIPFQSEQHLNANQIDIFFEFFEAKIYDDHKEDILERERKRLLYEKGEWISKNKNDENVTDDEFDQIVI